MSGTLCLKSGPLSKPDLPALGLYRDTHMLTRSTRLPVEHCRGELPWSAAAEFRRRVFMRNRYQVIHGAAGYPQV